MLESLVLLKASQTKGAIQEEIFGLGRVTRIQSSTRRLVFLLSLTCWSFLFETYSEKFRFQN